MRSDTNYNGKEVRKILHVTPWFPPDRGGIAIHVNALCEKLQALGIDISIIAPRNILIPKENESTTMKVTRLTSIFLPGWPYSTLRSVSVPIDLGMRIRSIIKHGNFDLVHVHDLHYPISWMGIYFARKYNIPSILTLHGMYGLNPKVMGGKTRSEELMYKYLFSRVIASSNVVIGLTKNITGLAQKYSKRSTNYRTIPNGVTVEIFRANITLKQKFREKYKLSKDSIVVLFIGRLEHVKGIIEFANAMKPLLQNKPQNMEVLIVGSGSLESEVQGILSQLAKVYIIGWLPNDLIHEIYIASDIFVIPSKFEGLPFTVLEAMNAGLHIVYSPVGGIPEILEGYSMKSILTEVTSEEIEKVLRNLLQNGSLSKDINSLDYAQQFDWNRITQQIVNLYKQTISR